MELRKINIWQTWMAILMLVSGLSLAIGSVLKYLGMLQGVISQNWDTVFVILFVTDVASAMATHHFYVMAENEQPDLLKGKKV